MALIYQKLNNFKLNREIIHLIVIIKNMKKLNQMEKQMNIMNQKEIM